MNRHIIRKTGLLLSLGLIGCSSSSSTSFPAAPALGAVIDRMGRPGVNTALTDPFNTDKTKQDANKDAYNTAEASTWVTTYKPVFAKSIAIYDGLDGTCGNQFAAGMMAAAGRYDALAGVLADDQLYVNTGSGTCTTYLGVEANATGIIPNTDCGGRMLQYDVIKITYSLLAVGKVSGVTDGVTAHSDYSATFPFLAAPH
jgi:hypothetical protein